MKIEIIKPFEAAVELTKKILFQPFDLKKWCVIGFAAFLAKLGGGFNFNYNWNSQANSQQSAVWQDIAEAIHQIPHWIIIGGVSLVVVLVLALVIVFAWLRARGRLMFIDCIVKNRGAIAEPWREFSKQGNSLFVFSLCVGCGLLVVAAMLALPFFLPVMRGVTFLHLHDAYLISMIILWALVIVFLVLTWALVAHFMVAIMYRRRCLSREAFRIAFALIADHPGEITLYCLFSIALGLGAAMLACLTMCATCCIALIPYVGTVILLPLFVCLRAFSLLFLRQFGPDYDVWMGIPQPQEPPPHPA